MRWQVAAFDRRSLLRRLFGYVPAKVVLLILTESPYGSDKVYSGLRLASALIDKTPVSLFLMCDAVGSAVAGQSSASEDANLGRRIEALVGKGAEVKACGLCLEARGFHNARLAEGVVVGSMPELAEWVLDAERVVTL